MKIKIRFIIVFVLLATLILVSTLQVSAKAEKIPVSGTCTGLAFLDSPDYRYWEKEDGSKEHWRNNLILFWCDYDDDRLDGYMLASDNWNTFSNDNIDFSARTFGKGYSADENGNILDLWEGSYNAYYDAEWTYFMKMTYVGCGENQGMLAKLVLTYPWDGWPVIDVQGELLISGK
jgi:hypothetical protein